jgi:hypothetical protein
MSSRAILRRLQRARHASTFAPACGRVFAVPYLPGTASVAGYRLAAYVVIIPLQEVRI